VTVKQHIASSIPLGFCVYTISGDFIATAVSMIATVIMDIDHVFDQVVENKRLDPLSIMTEVYNQSAMKIVIMFFHSWELVCALILFALMASNITMGAIAVGMGFHLLIDNIYYTMIKPRIRPFMYIFTYRVYYGFKASELIINGSR
jgi:hypothetical protein